MMEATRSTILFMKGSRMGLGCGVGLFVYGGGDCGDGRKRENITTIF